MKLSMTTIGHAHAFADRYLFGVNTAFRSVRSVRGLTKQFSALTSCPPKYADQQGCVNDHRKDEDRTKAFHPMHISAMNADFKTVSAAATSGNARTAPTGRALRDHPSVRSLPSAQTSRVRASFSANPRPNPSGIFADVVSVLRSALMQVSAKETTLWLISQTNTKPKNLAARASTSPQLLSSQSCSSCSSQAVAGRSAIRPFSQRQRPQPQLATKNDPTTSRPTYGGCACVSVFLARTYALCTVCVRSVYAKHTHISEACSC